MTCNETTKSWFKCPRTPMLIVAEALISGAKQSHGDGRGPAMLTTNTEHGSVRAACTLWIEEASVARSGRDGV
jgi:hypothetical protein